MIGHLIIIQGYDSLGKGALCPIKYSGRYKNVTFPPPDHVTTFPAFGNWHAFITVAKHPMIF